MSHTVESLLVLVLVLCTVPALAAEIALGRDSEYDRASVETYAWVSPRESEEDPLTHQRIVNAVDYWMMLHGRRAVQLDESPDVLLTYHSDSTDEVVVDPARLGYQVRRSWRWLIAPRDSTARGRSCHAKGTLVLDIWDARARELVFRGAVSDAVPARPDRRDGRIAEGARRLVAGFDGGRAEMEKDERGR